MWIFLHLEALVRQSTHFNTTLTYPEFQLELSSWLCNSYKCFVQNNRLVTVAKDMLYQSHISETQLLHHESSRGKVGRRTSLKTLLKAINFERKCTPYDTFSAASWMEDKLERKSRTHDEADIKCACLSLSIPTNKCKFEKGPMPQRSDKSSCYSSGHLHLYSAQTGKPGPSLFCSIARSKPHPHLTTGRMETFVRAIMKDTPHVQLLKFPHLKIKKKG